MPEAERPIPPESSTLDALRLTRPPQVSSSGWRSRKRTAPPSAPEPYSVPCGPRSTSTRSMRSEERRYGKECVSTFSSRRLPTHSKKKRKVENIDNQNQILS